MPQEIISGLIHQLHINPLGVPGQYMKHSMVQVM